MKLLQLDFDPEIAGQFGSAEEQSIDFLGLPLFDGPGLWKMLILFGINLLVCWIITHFFYYRKSRRRDYYFTYLLFSTAIFFILNHTYLLFSTAIFFILNQLQTMKVEVGIVLGLFGIFSMIRYRTEQLPIREMTYLFVLIAISIINGAGMATSYVSFIAVNVLFILIIAVLEAIGMFNRKGQKIITHFFYYRKSRRRDYYFTYLLFSTAIFFILNHPHRARHSESASGKHRLPEGHCLPQGNLYTRRP